MEVSICCCTHYVGERSCSRVPWEASQLEPTSENSEGVKAHDVAYSLGEKSSLGMLHFQAIWRTKNWRQEFLLGTHGMA